MSDFLSKHLGAPTRINLGARDDGDDYYVDVRRLDKGDLAACAAKLQRINVDVDFDSQRRKGRGEMNYEAFQEEIVSRSIIEWNLDGPEGPLPYKPLEEARKSYRRLPAFVADQIFDVVNSLNAPPSSDEAKNFRDADSGAGEGSETTVGGTGPDSDGDDNVGEVWGNEDDDGPSSAFGD